MAHQKLHRGSHLLGQGHDDHALVDARVRLLDLADGQAVGGRVRVIEDAEARVLDGQTAGHGEHEDFRGVRARLLAPGHGEQVGVLDRAIQLHGLANAADLDGGEISLIG